MKRTQIGLVVLALFLAMTAWGLAQEPQKERQFVYGVNAFSGLAYEGTYYPLTTDTLYLMADVANIISPRETLIYFWPLTNDYKADWDALNEVVAGKLEVWQGNTLITTLSQTEYIIQYPHGLDAGEVHVYTGADAPAQYAEFDRLRIEFRQRVAGYYRAMQAYRQDLQARAESGKAEGEPPPPPDEPAPFLFFSTNVHSGFPVTLPPGEYAIRVVNKAGRTIPGSERNLVVFAHIREAIGYTIIPHDKWTIPEQSQDPSQVFYLRDDSVIYLQPFSEREYNDLYYTRLVQPQTFAGDVGRRQWVSLTPVEGGILEVVQGGQVVERIERKAYIVRQYTGAVLGYEILDRAAQTDEELRNRRADFEGFEIRVAPGQSSFSVRLVDESGRVIPGSQRRIKRVSTTTGDGVFLLPLVPLIICGGLALRRRRQLRNA